MADIAETTYLPDRRVAQRYGVAVRTLDRWDKTPDLRFPPPTYINGRKYRDLAALSRWERERAAHVACDSRRRTMRPGKEANMRRATRPSATSDVDGH